MKQLTCAGIVRYGITFAVYIIVGFGVYRLGYASEEPQPENRYEIIKPMYLMAVYDSLNDRRLSRETARAYLHSTRYYDKSWVAFQVEVPAGTIMTIIGSAPKVWHLPFRADRYFVRLDPDISQGLDVLLELNRGVEGNLDGLNSELFRRMEK